MRPDAAARAHYAFTEQFRVVLDRRRALDRVREKQAIHRTA